MGVLSVTATVSGRLAAASMGLLVIGAAVFATGRVGRTTEPVAIATAPEPLLMEPPGGPILWGLTTAQTTVPLDGTPHQLAHPRGRGMTVRFTSPGCVDGDLEVTRLAPAPRLVSRWSMTAPTVMAYVPDGTYELACPHDRNTTRLVLVAD